MANYVRVYTYIGPVRYESGERSVPFSAFTVSGDINVPIYQIVSIKYEHYHSRASTNDVTLKGRLVIGSDTVIDGRPLTVHISKNTMAKYENYFDTLPTADQFANIQKIQTVDDSKGTIGNDGISWFATAEYPIVLTVEFTSKPAPKWTPQITTFSVKRVNSNGADNEEGTYISTTLNLAFASGAPTGQAKLMLYTSTNPDAQGNGTDISSKISSILNGTANPTQIITGGSFNAANTYYFTLVLSIGDEAATASAQAFRFKTPIHITNNGVSFGGYSNASASSPKEEFHNPVVFHNGFSVDSPENSRINLGIQTGYASGFDTSGGSYKDVSVTFTRPFKTKPIVTVGFETGSGAASFGHCCCAVLNDSRTLNGFTIRFYNGDTVLRSPSVTWIAIGNI